MRVEINPTQLNNFGLGLEDVRAMLSQQNANLPKGQLSDERTTADILANDQLLKAKEYKPLIVAYRNGAAVRLSDIAKVQDSVENIRAAGFLERQAGHPADHLPSTGREHHRDGGSIQSSAAVAQSVDPCAINMQMVLDRTTTIRASVLEVERTLVIAIVLVDPRCVSFPAKRARNTHSRRGGANFADRHVRCDVPVRLQLDNLSLMALTISTGFVVDDAIVVIENVSRHIEQGVRPMQAALKGAREVGFTVLSISLSLVAVFTPILLMGGIVGRLFREFAVVLSTAILVSLVISLTTTPMMCARLLRSGSARVRRANKLNNAADLVR